jgi:hypothetical protein
MADVYHKDQYLGKVENPQEFVENIRFSRRRGEIDANINISYNDELNEVYIQSGKGRLRRPSNHSKRWQTINYRPAHKAISFRRPIME